MVAVVTGAGLQSSLSSLLHWSFIWPDLYPKVRHRTEPPECCRAWLDHEEPRERCGGQVGLGA